MSAPFPSSPLQPASETPTGGGESDPARPRSAAIELHDSPFSGGATVALTG